MEGIDKVQGKRKKTRPPRGAARRSIHSHVHSHPLEVRRKAVQLYLEEGFSPELIARQMGVGRSTLSKWVRLYRDQGEAGLKSKPAGPSSQRPRVAAAQAEEGVAKATLASLIQKVRQEVFSDYADLQVAKDKITLSQKAEAEANLDLAEGRYQSGYGNIIELTDAQFLLTASQVQEIVSRYECQTAAANLDVAVGRTPAQ